MLLTSFPAAWLQNADLQTAGSTAGLPDLAPLPSLTLNALGLPDFAQGGMQVVGQKRKHTWPPSSMAGDAFAFVPTPVDGTASTATTEQQDSVALLQQQLAAQQQASHLCNIGSVKSLAASCCWWVPSCAPQKSARNDMVDQSCAKKAAHSAGFLAACGHVCVQRWTEAPPNWQSWRPTHCLLECCGASSCSVCIALELPMPLSNA